MKSRAVTYGWLLALIACSAPPGRNALVNRGAAPRVHYVHRQCDASVTLHAGKPLSHLEQIMMSAVIASAFGQEARDACRLTHQGMDVYGFLCEVSITKDYIRVVSGGPDRVVGNADDEWASFY